MLWQAIEQELGANLIRVYELPTQRARLDATTVSGHHADTTSTLFQFGHSKDDPTLRQVKVMVAALDPLGLPLVTEVVAGNEADDPLCVPAIARVLAIIKVAGLLFVGDCKMSAVATRAYVRSLGHFYLCPLVQTGHTPNEMAQWIATALTWEEAVLTYRDEWLMELGFDRLKGAPLSLDPLFVKRDDQVVGLTNLLSIVVRLLTLVEFVVRCNLKQMTTLQVRILELPGLSPAVYTALAEN